MSGSSGEKTEQATPKKLRDSRNKGQVARSQEVVSTVSLFSVVAYIWINWGGITDRLINLIDHMAAVATAPSRDRNLLALQFAFEEIVWILLPVIGIAIVAGIFSNYLQIGSVFALEAIKPKLENVSPAKGVKKIFSVKQLIETLKSVIKIVFLSTLLYFVVTSSITPAINSLSCGFPCAADLTGTMITTLLLYSALAFVIIAVFDFVYQRHSHGKSLMMTKEEVKREYKESEGDPVVKGQRKQLAQELVMSEDGASARKASAVVVNPTSFAVAIHYDKDSESLPRVTAKGRNLRAVHIRNEAENAGVPVFRNIPLARKLFAEVEVNQPVPEEFFKPIAEILVWISRNKHLLYNGQLGFGVLDMEQGDHRSSIPGSGQDPDEEFD